MSAYTISLAASPRANGEWILIAPLPWEIGYKGSGLRIEIPAGFKSDLASIPVWARSVFDRGDSRYAKAAMLHDYMLKLGFDRITAAAEFHSALRASRVKAWRRLIMFLVVALWRFN